MFVVPFLGIGLICLCVHPSEAIPQKLHLGIAGRHMLPCPAGRHPAGRHTSPFGDTRHPAGRAMPCRATHVPLPLALGWICLKRGDHTDPSGLAPPEKRRQSPSLPRLSDLLPLESGLKLGLSTSSTTSEPEEGGTLQVGHLPSLGVLKLSRMRRRYTRFIKFAGLLSVSG